MSILHVTFLESQEICVCVRSQFGLQPLQSLRLYMRCYPPINMPIISMLFGIPAASSNAPKAAPKRRCSPLKESPTGEPDIEETSDYVMEEINEDPTIQGEVHMEEADYDRDTDSEEEKKTGRPHEERPRSKAMPMQPSYPPPLRLTSKARARPNNDMDEESESDYPQDNKNRSPLPRRPALKSPPPSIDQSQRITEEKSTMDIQLVKETTDPLPHLNSDFLKFVEPYCKECSTILEEHPDFVYVPEHERAYHEKVFWLKARFDQYWDPTFRKNNRAEQDYMTFIKRIYTYCADLILDDYVPNIRQIPFLDCLCLPRLRRNIRTEEGTRRNCPSRPMDQYYKQPGIQNRTQGTPT